MAQDCPGDCNVDGEVTLGEVQVGFTIFLGTAALDTCPSIDDDDDRDPSLGEVQKAFLAFLNGCPPSLDTGFEELRAGDLRGASELFAAAVAGGATDAPAVLLSAVTGAAAALIDDARLRQLAAQSGLTVTGDSSSLCDLDVELPDEVPSTAPTLPEIRDAVREVVLPRLGSVLDTLEGLPRASVVRIRLDSLPECLRASSDEERVEIDGGDIIAAAAAIEALLGFADVVSAYDVNVDLRTVVEETPRSIFMNRPMLLSLQAPGFLMTARLLLDGALAKAGEAVDFVSKETDDQDDDLLVIMPEEVEDAQKFALVGERIRQSLRGEVVLPVDVITGEVFLTPTDTTPRERLNLNPFFAGSFTSLTSFLPELDEEGNFRTDLFPDPHFGGSTPDLTQQKIDDFLSRLGDTEVTIPGR